MLHWFNYLFILIFTAGLFLLLVLDSRKMILYALGSVLLMAFVINVQIWPFTFALSKLITGMMAAIILHTSPPVPAQSVLGAGRTGKVFRATALAFGLVLIVFSVPTVSSFLSVNPEQLLISLFMMVCGFIQLGISQNPYRVFLGLITVFLGFEFIYGSLERSLLINGMFAAVDLLIALVGSYLINNSFEDKEE